MKIKANKSLKRKHTYDAGIDIPTGGYHLMPNRPLVINTYLTVDIPKGMMGYLVARTSAAKRGIHVAGSPIDSGYTGYIHAIVTNISDKDIILKEDEAICQLVVVPIVLVELEDEDEIEDNRGEGAFGSTGEKPAW